MEKGEKKQIQLETPAEAADSASVGAMLRQLRREKGLSIRDVAMETNISASNLVAIEHGNYQELPADTFLRGQVAIYARQLGIDGPETAKAFIRQRDGETKGVRKKNDLSRFSTTKKLAEPAHLSSAGLAGLLLLIIIISIAGFSYYTGWNPFGYLLQREEPPHHHLPAATALAPGSTAEPPATAKSSSAAQEQPLQEEPAAASATAQEPNASPEN